MCVWTLFPSLPLTCLYSPLLPFSGLVKTANDKFLDIMGYTLNEIKGHHHRMFVEHPDTEEYLAFWDTLKRGRFHSGEFKRITKVKGEGERRVCVCVCVCVYVCVYVCVCV